jgi:hypothetical protein
MLFPILVASVGQGDRTGEKMGPHRNELLVIGTTTISAKSRIQWDRFPIEVSGSGRVHEKNLLKNDRYDSDQGEQRNLMG